MSSNVEMQKRKIKQIERQIEQRTYLPKSKSMIDNELKLAKQKLKRLQTHKSPSRPTRKAPTVPTVKSTRQRSKSPRRNKSPKINRKTRRDASSRHQQMARVEPEQEKKQQEMTQCNKDMQTFIRTYEIKIDKRGQGIVQLVKFNKKQTERESAKEKLLSELNKHEQCKRFIKELSNEYDKKILSILRHAYWDFVKHLPTTAKNYDQLKHDFGDLTPGRNSLQKFINKYKQETALKRIKKLFDTFQKEVDIFLNYYTGKITNVQHQTEFSSQKQHAVKLIEFVKITLSNLETHLKKLEEAKKYASNFIKSLNTVLKQPKSLSYQYVETMKEAQATRKRLSKK